MHKKYRKRGSVNLSYYISSYLEFYFLFIRVFGFPATIYLINRKKFYQFLFKTRMVYYRMINNSLINIIIVDIDKMGVFNKVYGRKEGDCLINDLKLRLMKKFGYFNVFNLIGDKFIIINKKNKDNLFLEELYYDKKYKTKLKENEKKEIDYNIELNIFNVNYEIPSDYISYMENIIKRGKKEGKNIFNLSTSIHTDNNHNDKTINYLKYKIMIDDRLNKSEKFELLLFGQSIVNIEEFDNKIPINHYEILSRLYDKENNKIISPFHFIDLIYSSNSLMIKFNQIFCKKVLELANSNPDTKYHININYKEISNYETYNNILSMIQQLKYKNIVVEFIEVEEIESENENFINFVQLCHLNSISTGIDDFGSGYSNFSYLDKLEVEYVKLDGSIIKNIEEKKNIALVKSIVSFCNSLNMKVIAEYVENENILNKCRELNIQYYQGYYFYKPENLTPKD